MSLQVCGFGYINHIYLRSGPFAGEDNLLVDWSEIATGYGGMVYAYNPSAQEVEQKDSVDF